MPHVRTETADGEIVLDLYGPPNDLQRLELTTTGISTEKGGSLRRRAITTFLGLYAPDAVLELVGAYDDALDKGEGQTSSARSGDVTASLIVDTSKERAVVVLEPVDDEDD